MTAEQRVQIEELYLQMYNGMMAYARSSLSEEALAEEAIQETFRIACQKQLISRFYNTRNNLCNQIFVQCSYLQSESLHWS